MFAFTPLITCAICFGALLFIFDAYIFLNFDNYEIVIFLFFGRPKIVHPPPPCPVMSLFSEPPPGVGRTSFMDGPILGAGFGKIKKKKV